jgi:hypothetical protein
VEFGALQDLKRRQVAEGHLRCGSLVSVRALCLGAQKDITQLGSASFANETTQKGMCIGI